MLSNHLILCCPLLLLPSIFPSIGAFSNESSLHVRALELQLRISPSNEYSGLIFYRIDWFDLLAVQGTLKSLLQHHNSKASVLWCSVFCMIQLSHPYMTNRKTIDLTVWAFVSKVMFLLFNTLSRFVIAFLPRSKHLLISGWDYALDYEWNGNGIFSCFVWWGEVGLPTHAKSFYPRSFHSFLSFISYPLILSSLKDTNFSRLQDKMNYIYKSNWKLLWTGLA